MVAGADPHSIVTLYRIGVDVRNFELPFTKVLEQGAVPMDEELPGGLTWGQAVPWFRV